MNEEPLRVSGNVARIKLASNSELTGERRALSCNIDERAHKHRAAPESVETPAAAGEQAWGE